MKVKKVKASMMLAIKSNIKLMAELTVKNNKNYFTICRWVESSNPKLLTKDNVAIVCRHLELPTNDIFEFVN